MTEERVKDPSIPVQDKEKTFRKLERIQEAQDFFQGFDAFVEERSWNRRFEIPLKMYLDMLIDPCMRVFIGLEAEGLPLEEEESEVDVELVDLEKDRDLGFSGDEGRGERER